MYFPMNDTMPSEASPDGPITARSARLRGAEQGPSVPVGAHFTFQNLLDGIKLVSTGLSVARTLVPVVKVLRLVGGGGPLGWIGLTRRRGPLATLSLLGAGIAMGAGAGLLLAPARGASLRRSLVDRWSRDPAKQRTGAEPRREDVEDGAGRGGQRIAPWVSASTVAIQDAPRAEVDAYAVTPKAGAPVAPPDHEHAAMADSEAAKPTRVNGAAGYRFG